MPTAQKSSSQSKAELAKSADAIELLKSDHRQVEEWFEQFEKSRSVDKKVKLAKNICAALTAHTKIEEEIFYPTFIEATGDEDMHDEALVEHDSAKQLIAEIEDGKPGQDMWEAKVTVLSEYIKHHVKEEEQRNGMFAKAKKSDMDLEELGEQMAARKKELMNGSS